MPTSDPLIRIEKLSKIYRMGKTEVRALDGVDVSIDRGEFVAIMGPSGSGKSTLMSILGCLDRPTSGDYFLEGKNVARRRDAELARIRNRSIGFVFQSFNLLPLLSAYENVELPLIYARKRRRRKQVTGALEALGLGDRMKHKPIEMSGGQRQRVAIARALANEPSIIMADEPTGNLDSKTTEEVMDIFEGLNGKGLTIIMVTHEKDVADRARRILRVRDGLIVADENSPGRGRAGAAEGGPTTC